MGYLNSMLMTGKQVVKDNGILYSFTFNLLLDSKQVPRF